MSQISPRMMKKIDRVSTFNIDSEIEYSISEFVTIFPFSVWLFSIFLLRLTFLVRLQKKLQRIFKTQTRGQVASKPFHQNLWKFKCTIKHHTLLKNRAFSQNLAFWCWLNTWTSWKDAMSFTWHYKVESEVSTLCFCFLGINLLKN